MRIVSKLATGAIGVALFAACSATGGYSAGGASSAAPKGAATGYSAPGYSTPDYSTPQESASSAAATSAAPAGATRPAITELKTAKTALGDVVVDGNGMVLYMFAKDTKGAGQSACTGQCLTSWPLVVAGTAPKVTGVTGTIALIPTADGRHQVTLNGWPLYYFGKDAKAGDTNGQGVGQVWFVLDKTGTPRK